MIPPLGWIPLAAVLCRLHATDSIESSFVRHLLTSKSRTWQLIAQTHLCFQALVNGNWACNMLSLHDLVKCSNSLIGESLTVGETRSVNIALRNITQLTGHFNTVLRENKQSSPGPDPGGSIHPVPGKVILCRNSNFSHTYRTISFELNSFDSKLAAVGNKIDLITLMGTILLAVQGYQGFFK